MRNTGMFVGAITTGFLAILGGCQLIAGVKDAVPYPPDAGMGGSGGQGAGGAGGAGGATMCSPGSQSACYSGPMGTKGVGLCAAGMQVCREDGAGYEACSGEVLPKVESCAVDDDENCDGYDCVQWAQLFGDGADQQARAVAVDGAGNIYVVGTFAGQLKTAVTTLNDAGSSDAFILKVAPNGSVLWAKSFGDASFQLMTAVAIDSTDAIIVGGWSDTSISLGGPDIAAGLFAAKFTGDGVHVWSNGLGSSGCGVPSGLLASIATTASNDVVVGGSFCGSLDLGDGLVMSAGEEDAFVAKLRGGDGSGTKINGGWLRTYGDNKSQEINSVAVDASHSQIVATGNFKSTITAGNTKLTSTDASPDLFYLKLFPDGSDLWAAAYGSTGNQIANGLVINKAGDLIISGQFNDPFVIQGHTITAPTFSNSTFLVSFDLSDTYIWSKTLQADTNSSIFTTSLKLDAAESLFISGFFTGNIDFGDGAFQAPGSSMNMFLAKLTSSGAPTWKRHFINKTGALAAPWLAVTPSGEAVLAGILTEPIDFGTGPLVVKGGLDAFLAKFAP